jgi:hypothetical protein
VPLAMMKWALDADPCSLFRSPGVVLRVHIRYVPPFPLRLGACDRGGLTRLAITFVFACICIQVWPSGMTIWALIIALLICTSFPSPQSHSLPDPCLMLMLIPVPSYDVHSAGVCGAYRDDPGGHEPAGRAQVSACAMWMGAALTRG